MSNTCLECGGTGVLLDGRPCPVCSKERISKAISSSRYATVPMQYQGVAYDKSFLPMEVQKTLGSYMEDLLSTISADYQIYQKNLLICSRPNSGKTIWAYNLITILSEKGYNIPTLMDLMTVREHLNYRSNDSELQELVQSSRGLIIRVPADVTYWMFDIMQAIIERRVARNGFTVFLYSGSGSKLKEADKNGVLRNILGSGAFHTIKMEDFTHDQN